VIEMAVKTMKGATRGAGQRQLGELLPCRRHHGGALPLSPLPSWLLGSCWRLVEVGVSSSIPSNSARKIA
jgi:hypothetical protein